MTKMNIHMLTQVLKPGECPRADGTGEASLTCVLWQVAFQVTYNSHSKEETHASSTVA